MKNLAASLLALLLVACAATFPPSVQAQTTGLQVKDANGVTQTTCAVTQSSQLVPCHVGYGFDGTNYDPVAVDSSGRQVFTTTSTINVSASALPLPVGASTAANQLLVIAALGTPFQAGGSIANTTFGISGTLPAFTATPTVNLGTLAGAATAANQSTLITNLGTLKYDGGGNLDVNCITGCGGGGGGGAITAAASSYALGFSADIGTGSTPSANSVNGRLVTLNTTLGTPMQQTGGSVAISGTPNFACTSGCSGSNASVGTNGATAPSSSTQIATVLSGNLQPVSLANPLPITGSISATNPSVSATGATAPTSATLLGIASGGNLAAWNGAVTGTFWQATQPVSAASLPLPTGAATGANQTNGAAKTQIVDGTGNVIASTSNNLNVQCANCTGSGVSAVDQASMTPGTSLFAGGGGFYQTTATANPLTTGTQGMFQVTANRALFSNLRNSSGVEIGTASTPLQVSLANTGANGTALVVNGSGVTQPVSGTFWQATQPVSGSIGITGTLPAFNATPTFNLGTLNGAATAANQSTIITDLGLLPQGLAQGSTTSGQGGILDQGAVTSGAPSYTTGTTRPLSLTTVGAIRTDSSATTQPVSGNVGVTGSVAVTGTFYQATQPVSAASLPLPTGASTAANQVSGNSAIAALPQAYVPGAVTSGQSGALIMGAATSSAPSLTSASTYPISLDLAGNVRINCTTGCNGSNASVSTNNATAPVSSTQIGTIDSGGKLQAASSSNPIPVAIAGTVPVSGSFYQATQPVSAAALPLPTGAASSSLQASGNTTLTSSNTYLSTLAGAVTSSTVATGAASGAYVAGAVVDLGTGSSPGANTVNGRLSTANTTATSILNAVESPIPTVKYFNINSATTTTVKSGAGSLYTITINTPVASATITLYDNTAGSGTKIATITLPSTITSLGPMTLNYGVSFATGLTIVTSGATDLTASYE